MKGTAHMVIGATTGFIIGNAFHSDLTTRLIFVGLGGITGLIPDLDIDGELSNKITLPHKIIRTITQFIGILMIIYSYLEGERTDKWLGIGVGLGIIVISSFITKRRMLTVTGIGVLAGGFSLNENWLWLFGIYIIIASLISHRSYTHSILGILFFGVIAFKFEASLRIQGVFITCILGYISHLIADMKLLPFNKRGVKFFLPFSSKDF
ncbi:metal-dependent hydrolase [Neobacillus ginsengisoli]|uniref:Inner membrane protein n=1 Tax=Neobacillus ginsengisoli TaxID=904295 RepID=A0ABT9XXA6_9BACI|nr:metal-dependent hydrolase [Neobacillus ginsengisoli]MDQ0200210.1 inner membrane protein [Neobacillus ginsengisoli]